MFRNHLIISLRSLWRNKTYSLISILGLAVGLASGILIFLWVQHESSYDDFHSHPENLHRLVAQLNLDGKVETYTTTVAPLAVFGKNEISSIINTCRISEDQTQYLYQYNDKSLVQENVAFVDEAFFEMFNFPLVKGDSKKPFRTLSSVVLTEASAKKYFGMEDPIGKILRVNGKYDAEVSGIIKTIPSNSNFQYEVLISFNVIKNQFFQSNGGNKTLDDDWDNFNYSLYFELVDPSQAVEVSKHLQVIHQRNQHDDVIKKLTYILQPIRRIHLYNPDGSSGRILLVEIMALTGVIIILIACINYVNLVTALATKRAKEVSMRKMVGANGSQLFIRFFVESFMLFLGALVITLVIIFTLIPFYNEISGQDMVFRSYLSSILAVSIGTSFVTLMLSGAYPAWMLLISKVDVQRGVLNMMKDKNLFLRNGLVVFQFVVSIVLIVATIGIGTQLNYIRNKNLGYKKENILTFEMREMNNHFDAAKTELLTQPGVLGVSASGLDILYVNSSTSIELEGKYPKRDFMIKQLPVDRDFLKVLDLKLMDGNGFSNTPTDSTNYILNEAAVVALGIKDPIGTRLKFHGRNGVIVGVVKDFHYQNLYQSIAPLIIYYDPFWRWKMYVRIAADEATKVIEASENVYKKYNSGFPFTYSFLDDDFAKTYSTDRTIGKLFFLFAGVAIFISCMGLFTLATYTTENRMKEIGIRKILGAGSGNIGLMLSKDFIKLVLIAMIFAFPIAWLGLNKMLESYAYRAAIGWWIFALTGLLTLFVALLTISSQAIRAALSNPVKTLKTDQ